LGALDVSVGVFLQQQAVRQQGRYHGLHLRHIVGTTLVALGDRRPRITARLPRRLIDREGQATAVAIGELARGLGRLVLVPAGVGGQRHRGGRRPRARRLVAVAIDLADERAIRFPDLVCPSYDSRPRYCRKAALVGLDQGGRREGRHATRRR